MNQLMAIFTSPGSELMLGPFTLRWYGLLIAISVLIGLNLSNYLASQRGLPKELVNDLFPILILSAIVGARIYYVAFEWKNYQDNFLKTIAIWEGGIAIHGALIAGTLSVMIYCRIKNQSFWDLLDSLVPSVALGQAIGRWGNFFNNEAFGIPTNLPWKISIPEIYRPEAFANDQYFHPTFLYESICNLIIFSVLISLFKFGLNGRIKLPKGALSCIYIVSYSIGRFWIEGLRIDSLCVGALPPYCAGGIRVAQLISISLVSIGSLGIWWLFAKQKNLPEFNNPKILKK